MSNTPNANDMIPSETPSNTTTTNRWTGESPCAAAMPGLLHVSWSGHRMILLA
jgi:hypothetical protein